MKETFKTSRCGLYFYVLMFCKSTLKKEADVDAENSTITYKTGRCHNPQRHNPELLFLCCRSS